VQQLSKHNEMNMPSNLTRPAHLLEEQATPLLGFKTREIPILIKAKLLKPIGNPTRQGLRNRTQETALC
jgi:hypothetical protein